VQHETFESSIFASNPPPPAKRRRLLFNEDLAANVGSSCGTSYEPILDPFKVLRLPRTLILVRVCWLCELEKSCLIPELLETKCCMSMYNLFDFALS
jgi:hypothetical protein